MIYLIMRAASRPRRQSSLRFPGVPWRKALAWAAASALLVVGCLLSAAESGFASQPAEDIGALAQLGERYRAAGDAAGLAIVEKKLAGVKTGKHEALLALGRLLHSEGREEEAASVLERTLALKQDSVIARIELGSVYSAQGRFEKAARVLEQALKKKTRDYGIAVDLGKCYQRLGRPDRAEGAFALAKRIGPKNPRAYLEQGQAYLQAGAYAQARREFESLIAVDTTSPLGYSNLGNYYEALQQPQEAEGSYRQALRALETSPHPDLKLEEDALRRLGLSLQKQRRFAEAEAVFRQGLEKAGANAPWRASFAQYLGHLCSAENKPAEAERFYKEAVAVCETGPGCSRRELADAASGLGALYIAQGRRAEAEILAERLEKVCNGLAVNEDSLDMVAQLAELYGMIGNSAKAEALWRWMLAAGGEKSAQKSAGLALNALARICVDQGRWAEAEEFYRRAIDRFKEDGDRGSAAAALYSLAAVYDKKAGKGREAAAALEQAQALSPRDARLLLELGQRYLAVGDAAGLAAVERKLAGLGADRPEALAALGLLLSSEGKYAEAAPVLEQVAALQPDNFGIKGELALAYTHLDQCEKAARIMADVLKRRPEDAWRAVEVGGCFLRLGRLDRVKAAFAQFGGEIESSITVGTTSPFGYHYSGGGLDERKHPHEEEAYYRRKVDRLKAHPPADPSALQRLGSILYEQGKSTEAETTFRQGLATASGTEWRSIFLWSLGDASIAQNKPAQAEESFKAAVAACEPGPGCSRAAWGFATAKLGLFYAEHGRQPEAEDLAERLGKAYDGVPIDDESVEVLSRLADLYGELGRSLQAQALLHRMLAARSALAVRWGMGRAAQALAKIYQAQGQWVEAEELYLEAIEALKMDGDEGLSAGALDGLAAVYEAEGKGVEAAEARRQARVKLNAIKGRRDVREPLIQ